MRDLEAFIEEQVAGRIILPGEKLHLMFDRLEPDVYRLNCMSIEGLEDWDSVAPFRNSIGELNKLVAQGHIVYIAIGPDHLIRIHKETFKWTVLQG